MNKSIVRFVITTSRIPFIKKQLSYLLETQNLEIYIQDYSVTDMSLLEFKYDEVILSSLMLSMFHAGLFAGIETASIHLLKSSTFEINEN